MTLPAKPSPFDAESFLATLTELPGVYRMIGEADAVLYVGKAKNLKKRVASYFRSSLPSPRIALMVAQIVRVEITTTNSEAEALILENNLIKALSPRYNILFRDDKSYPYILLTRAPFPRLAFYRGHAGQKGECFGPYPSSPAVRESIHLLQKMFRLRTCEDSVFDHRSRPCLLYQIKRCSGPCVGLISLESYAEDVRMATRFLEGGQQEVLQTLSQRMEAAANRLEFEEAALFRDQIRSLRQIQEKQFVESAQDENIDIIVLIQAGGETCVNIAMVRGGRHLGDRPQFPEHVDESSPGSILEAFLLQHYASYPPPKRILCNILPEKETQENVALLIGRERPIHEARSVTHKAWVRMAEQNASLALANYLQQQEKQEKRLKMLLEFLSVEQEGEREVRIECFDISHTQGELTVASCVVFQGGEMRRQEYRRFNIDGITPGDDFAAIRQAVYRRYEKVLSQEGVIPTIILIDGGKGQLSVACDALQELGFSHQCIVGVAKGEARKPGTEFLIFPDGREPVQLGSQDPALHLIQEIRDEAHRFAITGHRAKRNKARKVSVLDEIEGIGSKRRRALLTHFGSTQGVRSAGIDQLCTVPGISRALAESIYAALH